MARKFNGTSDLIAANAAASYSEANAYSVAFWVNYQNAVINVTPFSEASSTSANPFIQFQTNSPTTNKKLLVVARNNAGGTAQINSTPTTANVFNGVPHHFVYTQTGGASPGVYACFVDGVADITASYVIGVTTCSTLTIGALVRTTTAQFFPGTVWDVAKWSRKLTAGEALSLANGLPASHLAPDHYWPLFGTDSPEPDLGILPHTKGTLTGTTAANGARVNTGLVALT